MKSRLLFLVLSILIISSCYDIVNEYCEHDTYSDNAKLKYIILYETIELNEPGYILEEYSYDNKDRIKKVTCPQYDENSEIIGIVWYNKYYYNSIGQLSEINNYNANLNSSTGFINLKNYIYTYSNDGKKEKEYIEFPIIDSFEYSLYFYDNDILVRTEKYDNEDKLWYYEVYEYNESEQLVKELRYYPSSKSPNRTIHTYLNGLNVKTEVYQWRDDLMVREIFKSYDSNRNLIIKEIIKPPVSSMMSHVLRYEYYDN